MADIDINPSGDHGKMDALLDETGETIPLTPGRFMERSTWEPEREQEASFGGKTQRNRPREVQVEGLY